MRTLQISSIIIEPNRQRTEFPIEYIEELAESIADKGLFHAPVFHNDGVTLCAGECRLRAMTLLHEKNVQFFHNNEPVPKGVIPIVLLGELSPFKMKEAELEENVRRRNLSVQDHSRAVAELHKLRSEQAAAEGKRWVARQTAAEMVGLPTEKTTGYHIAAVKDSILIAEHLDVPEVAKAKTAKEAVKVIKKIKEAEHRSKLAEQFKSTVLAKTDFPHEVIHGDTLSLLPQLANERAGQYSVILTDPPYGVDADEFGDQADASHAYQDDIDYALRCYTAVAKWGKILTTVDAHAYVFCDINVYNLIRPIFEEHGWDVWHRPLIWFKGGGAGMLPDPEGGPRNTYEAILYARKGRRKVCHIAPDVINIGRVPRPTFGAEKPWQLFHDLLARSVRPGERVIDMFAGAGPIIPAATKLNVIATALEGNKAKCDYMLTRKDDVSVNPVDALLGGLNGKA